MNRKPIFDAVRKMLQRSFTTSEIAALDLACDLAEAAVDPASPKPPKPAPVTTDGSAPAGGHRLGKLSEEYESGGRGPGTVSSGVGDAGGVSYGTYQLASKTGTCAVFMKSEGKPWADRFGSHKPGTSGFSEAWKAIAASASDAFGKAQHAFIERTHYRPVVKAVNDRKGLDLDRRHDAVRDSTWSCSVQHGGAANILIEAIDAVDRDTDRSDPDYDRKLVEAIYKARTAYILAVAANPKKPKAVRDQLISITKNRYVKELANALAMFKAGGPAATPAPAPRSEAATTAAAGDSIDGNAVAAANGVAVKSAGVKIGRLHPKMEKVIVAVAEAARAMGLPQPVITSGNDSKHMSGSLHFKNRALDFRGNNIKASVGRALATAVAQKVGPDYDVVFEVFMKATNNHLHVEYDPK